jgi:hypothetical protein
VHLAVEHDGRDQGLPVLLVALLALSATDGVEGTEDGAALRERRLDIISAKELLGVRT